MLSEDDNLILGHNRKRKSWYSWIYAFSDLGINYHSIIEKWDLCRQS